MRTVGIVPPYEEALKSRTEKYVWPEFLGRDTDSSEDLAKLSIPGLWIFSDNDTSIPVDLSIERLKRLRETAIVTTTSCSPASGTTTWNRPFPSPPIGSGAARTADGTLYIESGLARRYVLLRRDGPGCLIAV